jgi:Rrf2 family protein
MKLSRTVVYAIQATMQLAQSGSQQPVPCSQLAAEGHMPERFLLQILRHLVTHGILHSTRGVEGGYTLERKPDDVSLLDIMEALEGPLISTLPPVEGAAAEMFQGRLREALDDITNSARRQLADIKLADLLPLAAASPAAENASDA